MAGNTPSCRGTVLVSGAGHYLMATDVHAITTACLEKVDRMASRTAASQTTRFSGHAILHASAGEGGALVGTNQALDCLKKNILTVLHPNSQVAAFRGKAESRANGLYRNLP